MRDSAEVLIEHLAEPALLLSTDGEPERVNRAFQELAEECGKPARLQSLFGPAIAGLLAHAQQRGTAEAFLPLDAWVGRQRIYRVAVRATGQDSGYTVLLVEMTQEIQWREQLFARNRELTVLHDVGAALSTTLELNALAERIYEQTSRIMKTRNFYIALHDWHTRRITFPIYVEDGKHLTQPGRSFGNGLTEHVIRTASPLLIGGDVVEEARALGIEPLGRPGLAWLGVPVIADGEAIGAIAVQNHERADAFDDHHLELLTIVAAQAAAAIRNARLFEAARQAFEELTETQARLLESERLRTVTETVGALNHEVNNPLATIVGNAQLLMRRREELPASVAAKVARMLEAAVRIQEVTARMGNLIQASSAPYPGDSAILDVRGSIARDLDEGA